MAILKYSVKFILQQSTSKSKPTQIRCFVRFNGTRSVFGTNIQIEPKNWNSGAQMGRKTALFDAAEVNGKLETITKYVDSLFDGLVSYPDAKEIELRCKEFIAKGSTILSQQEPTPARLISYSQQLYEKTVSGERKIASGKRAGQAYKPNSLKAYSNYLKNLREYAAHLKKEDFDFEEIDRAFYEGWRDFLYSKKYSLGYFSTMVKVLKTIMAEAADENLHSSQMHRSKHFTKPSYESDTIYLNVDQLDILFKHKYEVNNLRGEQFNYLEHAVDLFLVGCWTGLRFSDFSSITAQHVEGNFIRVQTEKTGERVTIPMHPVLRQIFNKYGQQFPAPISNQKLNEYIKEAAKAAGLTHDIQIRLNVGGKTELHDFKFYERITTHAARRSFATNMFKSGIPPIVIMAITGHRTEAAFLKYIRVSNEEKAQMMQAFWEKLGWH